MPVQEGLVGEAVAMLLVELGDQCRYSIGHLLQLGLAVIQCGLRVGQLGALVRLLAGAADRIRQALQALLDHVIACAAGQRLYRQLLGERTGDEDEGRLRDPLARQRKGSVAVESGQHVIGQDDIEGAILDRLDEGIAGPQALGLEVEASPLQLCADQLRIKRTVLKHEDAQALAAARSITHCAAPSRWADAAVAGW